MNRAHTQTALALTPGNKMKGPMICAHSTQCASHHEHAESASASCSPAPALRRLRVQAKLRGIRIRPRKVGLIRPLPPQREADLIDRVKKGDKAACETVIRSNIRLVARIASRYAGFGQSLLDLINEGNIALIRAAEHFDPARDGKLSVYASPWIKQRIERSLALRPAGTRARSARLTDMTGVQ